jgi:hypothetical protein
MQELEPTWGRALRVWWLIFWRGVVGGALLGGLVGGIFGFAVAILKLPPEVIVTYSPLLGAAVALPWIILVVRMALRKKYSDFRIALVPRT